MLAWQSVPKQGTGQPVGKMKSHVSLMPGARGLQSCSSLQPREMQPEHGHQLSLPSRARNAGWEELVLDKAMAPGTGSNRHSSCCVQLSLEASPGSTVASWQRWPHEHSTGRWGGGRGVTGPCGVLRVPLSPEGPPLTNTTFPHIIPLVTLLERDEALTESPEPWEATDNSVEVVMAHLEAARMVAHHGGLYHTNAEVKLQGKH